MCVCTHINHIYYIYTYFHINLYPSRNLKKVIILDMKFVYIKCVLND